MKAWHAALLLVFALLLAAVPWMGSDVLTQFGISTLLLAVLAQGWNIIGGYTGYASFGNSVFYGLGSYGVGIAMQPKILLCDEVMSGLNLVEIDALIDVIRKLRDQGISVLVIEHVIKAIKDLSNRLIVLHHGEKIADGRPDLVLSDAAVVQAYLGKRRA